jgi:release factor glutamine methyltransferase
VRDGAPGSAGVVVGESWRGWWRQAAERLGDERAARILVEEVSQLPAARLLATAGSAAPEADLARLEVLLGRVQRGEPLQYVVGHWGFRTLDLSVGPAVLIPRPETELVVEVALRELRRVDGRRAADLGTGSGAIALALVAELPAVEVLATDCSPAALAVATVNRDRLGGDVRSRARFLEGDWYGALPPATAGTFDLVVSNPPYVAEGEWAGLDPVVRDHEPRGALVAGHAGTEAIEVVVRGAPAWLCPAGSLVLEIAPGQRDFALQAAGMAGFADTEVLPDLTGRDRVLVARR